MPASPRIDVLQVDDDPDFAEYVAGVLGPEYRLRRVGSAAAARQAVRDGDPDLILLDLILPDSDGLVLCADLRADTSAPILICSATVRRRDAALGLRLGADAFMAKPFDADEFRARVEALLRRRPAPKEPPRGRLEALRVGELALERASQRVALAGIGVAVSPVELRILSALMRHPGDVLTRQDLVHDVWGDRHVCSDRTIDIHIRRLREKLAFGAVHAPPIVSVRGFGYKMLVPDGSTVGAS
ncbi:MAG TPA: response regulator transcription factor [Chloroflexota bacterium]|jgi:two-component system response regulator MtrA